MWRCLLLIYYTKYLITKITCNGICNGMKCLLSVTIFWHSSHDSWWKLDCANLVNLTMKECLICDIVSFFLKIMESCIFQDTEETCHPPCFSGHFKRQHLWWYGGGVVPWLWYAYSSGEFKLMLNNIYSTVQKS